MLHRQSEYPSDYHIVKLGVTIGAVLSFLDSLRDALGITKIYKAVYTLEASGVTMSTSLWYMADGLQDFKADAESLAYQLNQHVLPKIQSCMPSNIRATNLTIFQYDHVFDQSTEGFKWPINAAGTRPESTKTTRPAANMRFSLTVPSGIMTIAKWFKMVPFRGRVYIPISIEDVTTGETIKQQLFGDLWNRVLELGNVLAQPLNNLNPLVTYYPIRVKTIGITLPVFGRVNLFTGYSRVTACSPLTEVTFLSRRQN